MPEPMSEERLAEVEARCANEDFDQISAIEELIAEVRRLQAQVAAMKNAMGDDLCWYEASVQIPPQAEFLESCRRFHAQISAANGELGPGCMTIAQLEAELARERQRRFGILRVTGCSHSTACSIWGDDGQGGTAENFKEPLPCNCGALINYERQRAEAAEEHLDSSNLMVKRWQEVAESHARRAEAAETDTRRLDWLEKDMTCGRNDLDPRYRYFDCKLECRLLGKRAAQVVGGHKTIRDAVDAAMREAEKG